MLLSADPVAAAIPAIIMEDRDRQAAAPGFHSFDSESLDGTASLVTLEPIAEPLAQIPNTVLNSIDPELRAGSLEQIPGSASDRLSENLNSAPPSTAVLIQPLSADLYVSELPQSEAANQAGRGDQAG